MTKIQQALSLFCLVTLFAVPLAFAQDPTTIVENAYQDVLGRRADREGMRTFAARSLIRDGPRARCGRPCVTVRNIKRPAQTGL